MHFGITTAIASTISARDQGYARRPAVITHWLLLVAPVPTTVAPLALIATLLVGLALGAWAAWARTSPRKRLLPLPTEWRLVARRVLSSEERRAYNQLRVAFPQCIVLPKLPLVRLCQPDTPDQVQYWYELIGSAHVTFAVCNPSGHVLLVVDLEHNRSHSRRSTKIKESVLSACGIPRVHCAAEALPPLEELRALIPTTAGSAPTVLAAAPARTVPLDAISESPPEAPSVNDKPIPVTLPAASATVAALAATTASLDELEAEVMSAPAERPTVWRDSSVFLDPFFADDGSEPASDPESPADLTDWPPLMELRPSARGHATDDAPPEADRPWQRAPARYAGSL